MEDDILLSLPMDIMYKILTHISDPASLVCLASSCKLWRGLIKDSAFLDRLRRQHCDHGFTSSLLLGFFYQDNTESPEHLWQHHMDKNRCLAPSFMPMSELSQFIGRAGSSVVNPPSLDTFLQGLGASLNFYEPVASKDSFLALRQCKQDTSDEVTPDVLCVCNPLSGQILKIPSLEYVPADHFALLVTDDVGIDGCTLQSFQLVAIWIIKTKFFCMCYCSKTGAWRRPSRAPQLMDGLYLVSSPPAASHGVIHWLCGRWKEFTLTHVARLHIDTEELSYLELPHETKCRSGPLLGNSTDGGLLLLSSKGFQLLLWKHNNRELGNDARSWVLSRIIDMATFLPLRVISMQSKAKVRLEMFRGKSGTVVLWVDWEGLFLFSIRDGSLRKIDSEHVTKKHCLCPYEIDWLSCLAVTNLVVDGSLSLDVGRAKVQGKWRALLAKNMRGKTNAF